MFKVLCFGFMVGYVVRGFCLACLYSSVVLHGCAWFSGLFFLLFFSFAFSGRPAVCFSCLVEGFVIVDSAIREKVGS